MAPNLKTRDLMNITWNMLTDVEHLEPNSQPVTIDKRKKIKLED